MTAGARYLRDLVDELDAEDLVFPEPAPEPALRVAARPSARRPSTPPDPPPPVRTGLTSRYAAEHAAWKMARGRCLNPNHHGYRTMGARGIGFCSQWTGPGGFARFLKDVGPRPDGCSALLRRRKNVGYEPTNVYWGSRSDGRLGVRKHYEPEALPEKLTVDLVAVKGRTSRAAVVYERNNLVRLEGVYEGLTYVEALAVAKAIVKVASEMYERRRR